MLKQREVLEFVIREFEWRLETVKISFIAQRQIMIALHAAIHDTLIKYYMDESK